MLKAKKINKSIFWICFFFFFPFFFEIFFFNLKVQKKKTEMKQKKKKMKTPNQRMHKLKELHFACVTLTQKKKFKVRKCIP